MTSRRLAAIAFVLALPVSAAQKIAIVTSGELGPPARHGLAQLTAAIQKTGGEVVATAQQADPVIELQQSSALGSQGLSIKRGTYQTKPSLTLTGGDPTGLMYAALDTAERLTWAS